MAGRREKRLNERILDATFEARRANHRALLYEDDARDPALRAIQERFLDCDNEFEQRAIAKEFEEAIKGGAGAPPPIEDLQAQLRKLGPDGSAKQAIKFFPKYLRWDDGTPFQLDPFQKDALELALEQDEDGRYLYTQVDLWIPRGNGKTPLLAGLGKLRTLVAAGRPLVLQLGGDAEQAGLGLDYVATWLDDGELGSYFDAYSRVIRRRDGRGTFQIQPASGSGAHGRKPNTTFVDELWLFDDKRKVETYEGVSTAVFKLAALNGQLFHGSTSGYDKNTIGGRNWDSGMQLPELIKSGREGFLTIRADRAARRLFIAYGMPDGYELDLENDAAVLHAIRLANPGSWIDPRSLLEALRRADDVNAWLRFNLNVWTKAKGTWFKTGLWRALYSEFTFEKGDLVFVGVDCSLVHDATVVAWAKRLEDGRIAVDVEVFSPVSDVPAHQYFPDGVVDTDVVEDFILALARERGYKVAEIAYDPTYFHEAAKHLKEKGFTVIDYQPGSPPYQQAIQDFYKFANDGTLTHNGNEIFAQHAEAVAAEKREDQWKLYKLKASERFDAIPAAALAAERCGFDKRGVYSKRGLLFLDDDRQTPALATDDGGRTLERANLTLSEQIALGLIDDPELDDVDDDEGDEDEGDDEWDA
jgi:phage terminase large subunit-like protein